MGYIEDLRAVVGHQRIILCGSNAVIARADGRILMQQRATPRGRWGLPGGLMELGESAEDTARREVLEETGLELGDLRLLGVTSGQGTLCRAANGDEWYNVCVSYVAASYRGEPAVCDDESLALCWIDPRNLPEDVASTLRAMIRDTPRALTSPPQSANSSSSSSVPASPSEGFAASPRAK